MVDERYIVYRQDVCIIKDEKVMGGRNYYKLIPLSDETLSLNIPVDNEFLRPIISKDDAIKFIDTFKKIDTLDLNEKMIEQEYQRLIVSNSLIDLVKIIKTSYLRNKMRIDTGKKVSEKDNYYFEKAEKLLYTELSISLEMPYDDVKKYVLDKLA